MEGKQRVLVIVTFLIFFLFNIFFVLIFSINQTETETTEVDTIYEYNYFRVNSRVNTTSKGFVSTTQQLGEDEFISYGDNDGNFVLISSLESEEYVCSGSCFCEDDDNVVEERRSKSIVWYRSLIHLVAAVSSIVAYSKARDYFQSVCEDELSSSCSSVHSEMDSCSLLSESGEEDGELMNSAVQMTLGKISEGKDELHERDIEEERKRKKKLKLRRYICRGRCSINSGLRRKEAVEKAKSFGCEDILIKGTVEILTGDFVFINTENPPNSEAKVKFGKEHLNPQCREKSMWNYTYTYKYSYKKADIQLQVSVNLCVGQGRTIGGKLNRFHCRQFYPEYAPAGRVGSKRLVKGEYWFENEEKAQENMKKLRERKRNPAKKKKTWKRFTKKPKD